MKILARKLSLPVQLMRASTCLRLCRGVWPHAAVQLFLMVTHKCLCVKEKPAVKNPNLEILFEFPLVTPQEMCYNIMNEIFERGNAYER